MDQHNIHTISSSTGLNPTRICLGSMKETSQTQKLFWLDLEMTGLDVSTCVILEAAAVVTDLDLKPIEELQRVIYQPQALLDAMDEWCTKTHGGSGLTAKVPDGIPLLQAEAELVELAKRHFGENKIILAGNSIGHDRRFIDAYMPTFSQMLHYRIIDVSSYKEIFQSKYKIDFQKKETHRARDDIFESIAELAHYLSYVKP